MKTFAPYLSKALLERIDQAKACSDDWDRQNPEPHLKAEIASSYGLFSGAGWEAEPQTFQIGKAEPEKDGASLVYVNLTRGKPPAQSSTWRVAAVVRRESDHYAVDDVIYINDSVYDNIQAKPANKRLSGYLSAGCDGSHWRGNIMPNEPEALVRDLYQQVVARRPVGIPWGEDWKTFAPYLSRTLLHRIDLALACGDDWYRQNPPPPVLKPEFGWLELGIFSAGDEESELRSFRIERTESEKDGALRVYVMLTWGWPPVKPWFSHVAAVLVKESGRLALNDVIFIDEDGRKIDQRLSSALSDGCDGPRWVGFRKQRVEAEKRQ
jgi:hypothetical protein